MLIAIPSEKEEFVKHLATEAGYASVEQYVIQLIERDSERMAVKHALWEMEQGLGRSFDEFDREFRAKHGMPSAS